MTTYTVALSKGGSTKTTTAAELVAALAAQGRRVLAIDLDEQGNLTSRLGVGRNTEVEAVAADVLTGDATAAEAAIACPSVPGAYVIAGTHHLAGIDRDHPEIITALRDDMPTLAGEWDDIVIDTPPNLGLTTLAALAAAEVVVASVICSGEAYEQIPRLEKVIAQQIARRLRPGQQLHWIVPTVYDGRENVSREVLEMLNVKYGDRVTSAVRKATAAADAYIDGKPVSVYAPGSNIAADYAAALAPIISTPAK